MSFWDSPADVVNDVKQTVYHTRPVDELSAGRLDFDCPGKSLTPQNQLG